MKREGERISPQQQRLEQQIAEKYPGLGVQQVLLTLYKGGSDSKPLSIGKLAAQFGVDERSIRRNLPSNQVRDRSTAVKLVKGDLDGSQKKRVAELIEQDYPGQTVDQVILSFYRGDTTAGASPMSVRKIASTLGVRPDFIRQFIPDDELRVKSEETSLAHQQTEGRVYNISGLSSAVALRREERKSNIEHAVGDLKGGVWDKTVSRRYKLGKKVVRALRAKHVGVRHPRRLDDSDIQKYLRKPEVIDALLAWQGSEMDQLIISHRLLQGDPLDRWTQEKVGKEIFYSGFPISKREAEILEAIGAFAYKDEEVRKKEEKRARVMKNRRANRASQRAAEKEQSA